MRRARPSFAVLLALAWAGCGQGGKPDAGGGGRMPQTMPAAEATTGPYVLFVLTRITTFEVPAGAASESETLWQYLDEECVRVAEGVSLQRNGLRVGRGRSENLPDLFQALKQAGGRRKLETNATLLPGEPAFVPLKTRQPARTIFTLYEDRTLTGAEYPPGDDLLALVCSLNEDDRSLIRLLGMPQIRTTQRRPKIVDRYGVMLIKNEPDVFSFEPLTFRVDLRSKDFLVIGPSAGVNHPHSLGRQFLTSEREGVRFETVQVLVPEALAEPVKRP